MQALLEEIKASPGVMGSCVYTSRQGILASNLPSIFKAETQKRIVSVLHRIFKLNETASLDVNSFEVQYDEALVLVKKLGDTSSLVVLCEPDANIHLINMTTSMLTSDLVDSIESGAIAQPSGAAVEQPTKPVVATQSPQDIINGPLAPQLDMMKKALARCIGPVANLALESAVRQWLQQGEPNRAGLEDLARIMMEEIDDEKTQDGFFNEVRKNL